MDFVGSILKAAKCENMLPPKGMKSKSASKPAKQKSMTPRLTLILPHDDTCKDTASVAWMASHLMHQFSTRLAIKTPSVGRKDSSRPTHVFMGLIT